jgi:stalled ribosome alternative rescue factor ArfA
MLQKIGLILESLIKVWHFLYKINYIYKNTENAFPHHPSFNRIRLKKERNKEGSYKREFQHVREETEGSSAQVGSFHASQEVSMRPRRRYHF